MHIAVFSTKPYDEETFQSANDEMGGKHELTFLTLRLDPSTALVAGHATDGAGADAVCAFVNDDLNAQTLGHLKDAGVRLILMRCAGYNNVDLAEAERLGLAVGRVPAYSPHSVAEHTVALMLSLNRKIHRAYNRVREDNFALDGLMGFDMHGKTVGVVGTGKIGLCTVRILQGFGCRVIASDPYPSDEALASGAEIVPIETLLKESDIVTLHCPLTPDTHHLIDRDAIALMRPGAMLINTSRGALVDTRAVIGGLKSEHLGAVGLDVYEEEGDIFFENLSGQVLQDDVFARLTTFPNVLITGHQAFFTREALVAIAETTLENADAFADTGTPKHPVTTEASR